MRVLRYVNRFAVCLFLGFFAAIVARAGDIKGKITASGISTAQPIAVYIDTIPSKTFDPPTQHAVMDQKHMKFVPHVLVVLRGTTVDFLNSDATLHNVFWPSISGNKKLAHNMGTWPQGQKKSFTFDNLGVASLLCNVHQEMSGYVVVVPTPHFGVTDSGGSFEIKDVPPGHYTLKTWSEEGKPATEPVEVTSGTTTVNLTVRR
jgi:plastocyanin